MSLARRVPSRIGTMTSCSVAYENVPSLALGQITLSMLVGVILLLRCIGAWLVLRLLSRSGACAGIRSQWVRSLARRPSRLVLDGFRTLASRCQVSLYFAERVQKSGNVMSPEIVAQLAPTGVLRA